ncbi:hypothetical protein V6N12_056969 [Hibiscus sabdariffa]|uniref:Uncharacterized protein n=1 Tax=Hibiscus sabdariffa TaxID=183260 RepID=A0ABR2DCQ3_9ROSI
MMPLHNAIASARLILSLASESQTWSLVPQEETLKIKPEAEVIRILDCLDDLALHQYLNALMIAIFRIVFLDKKMVCDTKLIDAFEFGFLFQWNFFPLCVMTDGVGYIVSIVSLEMDLSGESEMAKRKLSNQFGRP